ncbi:hypothetical protein D3C72_2246470 [compost metagenome]
MQTFIENTGRQRVIGWDREPLLVRIMHEVTFGNLFPQIEVGKEVVGGKAFEVFAQSGGQSSFFAGAFAVGEAQRAIAIADMNRPYMRYRIQPGGLFDIKTQVA